jgi:hypothetical protein
MEILMASSVRYCSLAILAVGLLTIPSLEAAQRCRPAEVSYRDETCSLIRERDAEHRQDLLRLLTRNPQRGQYEPVAVRHLGKNRDGHLLSESAHFRILHNQNKEVVERIAAAAEGLRPAIHWKWFGNISLDWDGKCQIYLHANHKKYASKTKQWNAVGHARTLMMGDEISLRSIHLPCGLPNFFDDILPHELTHAVMAVRFRGRTPRWANEGMAMLAESRDSIDDRHISLKAYRAKDDLFAVDVLMKTEETEQINTLEYYAQSMSLVEFFVAEAGRQTFTKFLGDSLVVGYEAALRKHYGIASFAELERRWAAFAFSTARPPAGLSRLGNE